MSANLEAPRTVLLADKHVVVLGASSGLGAAAAVHAASLGARVTLMARRLERLEEVRGRCPGQGHEVIAVDAANTEELERAFVAAHERSGPAHGLVHSVGIGTLRPLATLKPDFVANMLAVNTTSALMATKLFVSRLKARADASVVWISSVQSAAAVGAGAATYAASKGALTAAMRVCAVELAAKKIRINSLNVGMVRTEIWEGEAVDDAQQQRIAARHPLGVGEPTDVAHTVGFLLSDGARWITGSTLTVDGGFSCHIAPV